MLLVLGTLLAVLGLAAASFSWLVWRSGVRPATAVDAPPALREASGPPGDASPVSAPSSPPPLPDPWQGALPLPGPNQGDLKPEVRVDSEGFLEEMGFSVPERLGVLEQAALLYASLRPEALAPEARFAAAVIAVAHGLRPEPFSERARQGMILDYVRQPFSPGPAEVDLIWPSEGDPYSSERYLVVGRTQKSSKLDIKRLIRCGFRIDNLNWPALVEVSSANRRR